MVAGAYTDIDRLQNADRAVTNIFNGSSGAGANPEAFALTARPRTASATVRYVSGVMDDYAIAITTTTTARVKSGTVLDLQYAYAFGKDERYRVTVGAINVFDRAPPSARYTGYLSSVADPYGRQSCVRLDARSKPPFPGSCAPLRSTRSEGLFQRA